MNKEVTYDKIVSMIEGKTIESFYISGCGDFTLEFTDNSTLEIETYENTDSCGDSTGYDTDFKLTNKEGELYTCEHKTKY